MTRKLSPIFLDRIVTILPQGTDIGRCFELLPWTSFRINALNATWPEIEHFLNTQGIAFQRLTWYEHAFVVSSDAARFLLDSALTKQGKIYAQGQESMLAVIALDPQPNETVLDLCAAPGSKTTQIAAHMQNQGELIANEPIRDRFFRLKSVVELLQVKVRLMMKDGRFLRHDAVFDRILVDAPCSSEGRFIISAPKSYAYWSPRKIQEMSHKQKGLLLNAARLLKPGGTLVYSTCTFAPEENEAVVDWFLRKTAGAFKLVPHAFLGVHMYPALQEYGSKKFKADMSACVRVLPAEQMSGFFLAKFKFSS